MVRCGVVAAMNPKRGMVAIQTEDDGYTIIELISHFDLDIGDEMAWEDGYALGSETYENRSKGICEEVFVQNHGVSASILRQQLLLT